MTVISPGQSGQRGVALLAELGDGAAQRLILGPDHDWILAKMTTPEKTIAPPTGQKRSGAQPAVGGQIKKKMRTS